jgi:hypothetical protein
LLTSECDRLLIQLSQQRTEMSKEQSNEYAKCFERSWETIKPQRGEQKEPETETNEETKGRGSIHSKRKRRGGKKLHSVRRSRVH